LRCDIKIAAAHQALEEAPFPDEGTDQLKSNNVSETETSMLTNFPRWGLIGSRNVA
jgi:hypothetical protein